MSSRREFTRQLATAFSLTVACKLIEPELLSAAPTHMSAAQLLIRNALTSRLIGQPQQIWLTDAYSPSPDVDPTPWLHNRLKESIQLAGQLLGRQLHDIPTQIQHTFGSSAYQTAIDGMLIHWRAEARHGLPQTSLSSTVQVFGSLGVLTSSNTEQPYQITFF